jgi:hypothetical protein
MATRRKKNLTTYPQALPADKGEGWTVINSGISALIQKTDLAGKVLVVPDGDGVRERNARLKELAGARWTPHQSIAKTAEKEKVDPSCLRAAEDFRLTFNVSRASRGLFVDQFSRGTVDPTVLRKFAEQVEITRPETVRAIPLVMAALGKTEGARVFLQQLEAKFEPGKGLVAEIKNATLKQMLELAKEMETKGQKLMESHLRKSFAGFPKSVEFARILMDAQDQMEGMSKACQEEVRAAQGKKTQQIELKKLTAGQTEKHQIKEAEQNEGYGKMTVKVPPLLMPVKAKNKIARHRVTEEGILPFQLYRLFLDGKVFLDPRKQKGGSVLVDISGSMGLTPEQVYEFVLKCPGATIAQYSGSYDSGDLVVVAHKGRIAPRHMIGAGLGGNIIDGPAVGWLAKQARPRIWVSDTQVTGIGDRGERHLRERTMAFCQKHQVKIVTKFDPQAVSLALHASHRKLLAKIRKVNPYGDE